MLDNQRLPTKSANLGQYTPTQTSKDLRARLVKTIFDSQKSWSRHFLHLHLGCTDDWVVVVQKKKHKIVPNIQKWVVVIWNPIMLCGHIQLFGIKHSILEVRNFDPFPFWLMPHSQTVMSQPILDCRQNKLILSWMRCFSVQGNQAAHYFSPGPRIRYLLAKQNAHVLYIYIYISQRIHGAGIFTYIDP